MTIRDLCDRSGIPVRTIRFYITERLLPGPEGRGSTTSYTEEHLTQLLLIRELVLLHVPLAEIRDRLEKVSPAELEQVLKEAKRRARSETMTKEGSPKEYIGAMLARAREQGIIHEASQAYGIRSSHDVWRRIRLRPGIELHVSLDMERSESRVVEQIVEFVRGIAKTRSGRNRQ
jgi:DNA-binding transcriptional MerR regulator